jgi:prevent-host-death family protein
MKRITVSDLRRHGGRYVRLAESGETFIVTNRGRPVALLAPHASTTVLDRLAAVGRVILARGDLLNLGKPLKPTPGVPLPSEALAISRG